MNKIDAMMRLAAIKREADELEKIISAPDVAPSLLTKPKPGARENYWRLEGVATGPLRASECISFDPVEGCYQHGSIFQSWDLAEAYADAIETMLLLRHQPGTVPAVDNEEQFLIQPEPYHTTPHVDSWKNIDTKATRLSPCFATREQAQAALDVLGAARIERMWRTLHHIAD